MKNKKYVKAMTLKAVLGLVLIGLLSLSSAFAASKGMRYKTVADVMDETMRTKEMSYLNAKYGAASVVADYGKYVTFLYEVRENGRTCSQLYAVESATGNIAGWDTNCDMTIGKKEYGEIAENTPIPPKVTVPEIAREVAKRKAERRISLAEEQGKAYATRDMTFADYLASLVGQSEERVLTLPEFRNPEYSQRLDSGKMLKTFSRSWHLRENDGSSYVYSCTYYLGFAKGKLVSYDAIDCTKREMPMRPMKGKSVPASQRPAPWSSN